ncbi:MAG: hypothetical protein WBM40_11355 [Thiohalocapsa sp.]
MNRAREIIATQPHSGGGYHRNAVGLLLGEVHRAHGHSTVDALIKEFDLRAAFGLKLGADFGRVGR